MTERLTGRPEPTKKTPAKNKAKLNPLYINKTSKNLKNDSLKDFSQADPKRSISQCPQDAKRLGALADFKLFLER